MENKIFTLSSGLKVAFKKTNSSVAYSALCIKSGTANEPENKHGLAHLTEHMIFRGCEKRSARSINDRLEKLGGDLNAYTAKEETVVYCTVLKEDIAKAIDLSFEIVFTSLFEEDELEKEKNVVADEINMCLDNPSDFIFEDYEKLLFKGHPLSRTILGTAASLKQITASDIRAYVRERYIPHNMSFVVVGDFEQEKVLAMVEKLQDKYSAYFGGHKAPVHKEVEPADNLFNIDKTRKFHQANCIIGTRAYPFGHPDRMALSLLTNILGGPASNSRLNSALREKKALVYHVDASYVRYSTAGVSLVYYGCDKSNVDKCADLVAKELKKVREIPLSPSALKAAKKQMIAQNAIASEYGGAQALSIGRSILRGGEYPTSEKLRQRIEAITSEQLQRVANEIFAEDRICRLIYR
ncbi:MAG: insulinase family protein [Bacteroidales bacterium]|nr:insulinase family protein [Bacteroidales bacterium]